MRSTSSCSTYLDYVLLKNYKFSISIFQFIISESAKIAINHSGKDVPLLQSSKWYRCYVICGLLLHTLRCNTIPQM